MVIVQQIGRWSLGNRSVDGHYTTDKEMVIVQQISRWSLHNRSIDGHYTTDQ